MSLLSAEFVGFGWPLDARGPVLKNVSFSVESGERLVITGASGVGKSTLCRLISGLIFPQEGVVLLDGAALDGPRSAATMVFQQYPCFDWLTVRGNVQFGRRDDRNGDAATLIARVGLREVENLYPTQLSGGMRQRVAIARALMVRPRVLILDESLAALDPATKRQLRGLLMEMQQDMGFALVMVLHSLDDVYALATKVLCLAGRPAVVTDYFPSSQIAFDDLCARIEKAIDPAGKLA